MRKPLHIFVTVAVLATALGGGFAATNLLQQTVPIVPGLQGCWRLDGSLRQSDCVAGVFREGISEVAKGKSGTDREDAVLEYVRRTESLAASDPGLASTCHTAMHGIGRSEGARAGRADDFPSFPTASSQLCTAGYVHGLAEGYLGTTQEIDTARIFPKLCHDDAASDGCAHGIGHALLRSEANHGDVKSAADGCSKLPDEPMLSCYNGVYMEFAMRRDSLTPTAEFVSTCTREPDVDRQLSCWTYLGLSLQTNDIATDELPKWCAKAPLPSQYPCIETYGRQLDVAGVGRCEASSDREGLVRRCINGAIGLRVGSGHSSAAEANRACASIENDSNRAFCRDAVKRFSQGREQVESI